MRNTLQRAVALARSHSPVKSAITVALVAAPMAFAAAPAQAATTVTSPDGLKYIVTVTGFTGAFAPGNWQASGSGSGTSVPTFNASTLVLSKTANQAGSVGRTITFDAASTLLKPSGAGNYLGGSYQYNWATTGPQGSLALTNTDDGAGTSDKLNSASTTSGLFTQATIDDGTTFGPLWSKAGSNVATTGTATITNFRFIAEYEVPGPLPLLGAGAAFAWSRKLRNRLKSASALA